MCFSRGFTKSSNRRAAIASTCREHHVTTTDSDFSEALDKAKLLSGEPLAESVKHVQQLNLLIVGSAMGGG